MAHSESCAGTVESVVPVFRVQGQKRLLKIFDLLSGPAGALPQLAMPPASARVAFGLGIDWRLAGSLLAPAPGCASMQRTSLAEDRADWHGSCRPGSLHLLHLMSDRGLGRLARLLLPACELGVWLQARRNSCTWLAISSATTLCRTSWRAAACCARLLTPTPRR